jgi:hypothetical protein
MPLRLVTLIATRPARTTSGAGVRPREGAPLLRGARFSACGRYRFTLTRRWAADGGTVAFVLLNPSTADARCEDPTIRRCMGLARSWGYGGIEVVNLFAWRATRPRDLRGAAHPESAGNERAVLRAARRADLIVVAWGNHGAWRAAGAAMLGRLRRARLSLACLGWTRLGQPRHVLYLRRDVRPQPVS